MFRQSNDSAARNNETKVDLSVARKSGNSPASNRSSSSQPMNKATSAATSPAATLEDDKKPPAASNDKASEANVEPGKITKRKSKTLIAASPSPSRARKSLRMTSQEEGNDEKDDNDSFPKFQFRRRSSEIRKKPKDMPRRPLSAYNFFFREERARVLAERKAANLMPPSGKPDPELFATMGKTIAARWKALDTVEYQRFESMAEQDMKRYRGEMEIYQLKKKLLEKAPPTVASFPSTLPPTASTASTTPAPYAPLSADEAILRQQLELSVRGVITQPSLPSQGPRLEPVWADSFALAPSPPDVLHNRYQIQQHRNQRTNLREAQPPAPNLFHLNRPGLGQLATFHQEKIGEHMQQEEHIRHQQLQTEYVHELQQRELLIADLLRQREELDASRRGTSPLDHAALAHGTSRTGLSQQRSSVLSAPLPAPPLQMDADLRFLRSRHEQERLQQQQQRLTGDVAVTSTQEARPITAQQQQLSLNNVERMLRERRMQGAMWVIPSPAFRLGESSSSHIGGASSQFSYQQLGRLPALGGQNRMNYGLVAPEIPVGPNAFILQTLLNNRNGRSINAQPMETVERRVPTDEERLLHQFIGSGIVHELFDSGTVGNTNPLARSSSASLDLTPLNQQQQHQQHQGRNQQQHHQDPSRER